MVIPLLLLTILLCVVFVARKKIKINSVVGSNKFTYLVIAVQAIILSIQIGFISWKIFQGMPQVYLDLIVGGLGFANQNKSAELNTIYVTIIAFVILYIFLFWLHNLFPDDQEFNNVSIKISLFGLTPTFFMFGQSLRNSSTTYLLVLSSALIIISIVVNGMLAILYNKGKISFENIFDNGIKLMLIPIFLGLSELGARLFLKRVVGIHYPYGILTVLLGIIYFVMYAANLKSKGTCSKVNHGVFLSQIGLPLLFFSIFTPPMELGDGTNSFFHSKPALLLIILLLLIVSLYDIFKRLKQEENPDWPLSRIVSPWALVAILIFLQSQVLGWPRIIPDEYHWGEFYSPWWSMNQYGYLPFVDLQPARGLVNYVPGFFSWLFYDNSLASQSLVFNQFAAIYIFIAFFAFRPVLGDFIAFLTVVSVSGFMGGLTGGIILSIASLAILFKSATTSKYLQTFWTWVGLSLLTSLFYVAEGSMFVIATIPFAFWLLYKSYRQSIKNLAISFGVFILVAGLLVIFTNIESIALSAADYLVAQAGVNDVAHGIAWKLPTSDISQAVTSGYLWQIIRFSWVLLLIPILIILIRNQFKQHSIEFQFTLIALFIISVLMIPRAAGRIDPVTFSRPGLASIGLIICGLPLVIVPNGRKPSILPYLTISFAVIFGLLGNQETQLQNARKLPNQVLQEPVKTVDGSALGLPTIGNAVAIDENQLQRQIEIKTVLEQLLGTQETYYDATNHSADYPIQGRPSPVSDLAPYNAPSTQQQERIVNQLEEKQIPLALIRAENIAHDGGSLSLRNYVIYDYLLEEYLPFADEFGRIWMIKSGQEERLETTKYRIGSKQEQIDLLTQSFGLRDLAGLPAAWGKSMATLEAMLSDQKDLLAEGYVIDQFGIEYTINGNMAIQEPDSYIVFEIPSTVEGDLLYLEFNQEINSGNFQVYWADDEYKDFNDNNSFTFGSNSSKYLVPMSAAPSWARSEHITRLRIVFRNSNLSEIQLIKVFLYTRT